MPTRSMLSLESILEASNLPQLVEPYKCEKKVFFLHSNERAVYNFFDTLQGLELDGYIFGCGATTLWGLLEAFPKNAIPKGLVLVDVEPRVVCYTKLFIQMMKQQSEFLGFVEEISRLNQEGWKTALLPIAEGEKEGILKTEWMNWLTSGEECSLPGGSLNWQRGAILSYANREEWFHKSNAKIFILNLVQKNYAALHTLAASGKIVIVYRDLFDSMLTKAVGNLPGYKESSSIFYMSNAVDHLLLRGDFRRNFSSIERYTGYLNRLISDCLKPLMPRSPNRLIIIDTLRTLDYFLRWQEVPPIFKAYHFLGGP